MLYKVEKLHVNQLCSCDYSSPSKQVFALESNLIPAVSKTSYSAGTKTKLNLVYGSTRGRLLRGREEKSM